MSDTGSRESETREKLWTPANIVTFVRICCVPVFVVAIISPWPLWIPQWSSAEVWKPWIAASIFILLAATDGLDGYLARSRGEVTNFGKFMDPLADKILVAAALLALVELAVLPSWVALIILAREFIVSGIRMIAASQGTVIAASWYGKAKTVAQIVAIVLFIVKDSVIIVDFASVLHSPLYLISWAAMAVALLLTIISMLDYFVKARELLGFTSSSRKARGQKVSQAETDADASGEVEKAPSDADAERDMRKAAVCPAARKMDQMRRAEKAVARRVVEKALACEKTVGTAESLTGGMIAAALTSIPGASAVVRGGIVSYTNEVKRDILGVAGDALGEYGAVSEEVACQMACGARKNLGVDIAVAATGIAGPTGAEPGKPVGTVWVAFADEQGVRAARHQFPGDRDNVRHDTVVTALEGLEDRLGVED